jgi:hypothetical protein
VNKKSVAREERAPEIGGEQFEIPILFLVFNQPDITKRVFSEIRRLRPATLYVAADGPRDNRPGEKQECDEVRKIFTHVDWPCKVSFRFLDRNLGCKNAVSTAISWFFTHEEFGIILEYDCLPDQSFFAFCRENIYRYRNDNRIMCISGDNFQDGQWRGDGSYYFSRIATIWGWATWRRSWCLWDGTLKSYPEFVKLGLIDGVVTDKTARAHWLQKFEDVFSGFNNSTWGFPWVYAVMRQGGFCITPNRNLVTNIGFTPQGTHATDTKDPFAFLPSCSLEIERHPSAIAADIDADNYFSKKLADVPALLRLRLWVFRKAKAWVHPRVLKSVRELSRTRWWRKQ